MNTGNDYSLCGGLILVGCQVLTKWLYHSSPQQDWEGRKQSRKTPKVMDQHTGGWKKESLCVKAEDVWPFPRRWASVGRVVAPEEKHFKKPPLNTAPFSSFLSGFNAKQWNEMERNGTGRYTVYLWSVWVSYPGYAPSQDLAHPYPAGEGECWGHSVDTEGALLTSSQNIGALSTPF